MNQCSRAAVGVAVAIAIAVSAKSTKSLGRLTAIAIRGGRHMMVLDELMLELSPTRSDLSRGLLNIPRIG
jgi:hypothetical protein